MGAIIRKNGSLFNRYCFDVPRSPRIRPTHTFRLVYEGMIEVERHNPDQRHNNSFLVKLGTDERGNDKRRECSDH